MRFWNTIKFKPFFMLGGWFLLSIKLIAGGELYPYSNYGFGRPSEANLNRQFGLGTPTYAFGSPVCINLSNPASFSQTSLTLLDVGVYSRNIQAMSLTDTLQQGGANLHHIVLAMPLTPWMGISFGNMPYTRIGVSNKTSFVMSDNSTLTEDRTITGGLNRLFLNTGWRIKNILSMGVGISYLYGELDDEDNVEYSISGANGSTWVSTAQWDGLLVNLGLQTKFSLDENTNLSLGAVYNAVGNVDAVYSSRVYSYSGSKTTSTWSATAIIDSSEGNQRYKLPSKLGFGIGIEKMGKWSVALDYTSEDWTGLTYRGLDEVGSKAGIISGGFECVGKHLFKYRIGGNYGQSYLSINNQQLIKYGIAFGISLPMKRNIPKQTTYMLLQENPPSITLGLELGKLGSSNSPVLESFVNFMVGISVADKWFIKKKYN